MMPWDWIGMVTMRRVTRCRTSTTGMMTVRPGLANADDAAEPEQHALLVLLDHPHREGQEQDRENDDDGDDYPHVRHVVSLSGTGCRVPARETDRRPAPGRSVTGDVEVRVEGSPPRRREMGIGAVSALGEERRYRATGDDSQYRIRPVISTSAGGNASASGGLSATGFPSDTVILRLFRPVSRRPRLPAGSGVELLHRPRPRGTSGGTRRSPGPPAGPPRRGRRRSPGRRAGRG